MRLIGRTVRDSRTFPNLEEVKRTVSNISQRGTVNASSCSKPGLHRSEMRTQDGRGEMEEEKKMFRHSALNRQVLCD